MQRRGDFTVNIAYVEDGVPLRGVVYAPAQGRLFYTLADGRAVEETGALDKDVVGRAGADRRFDAGQWRADGGGVEIAPRCGDRRLHRQIRGART